MPQIDKDQEREDRIYSEAIVDAYDVEEQAMGQYYYLDDKITSPFKAKCIKKRATSPLEVDEVIDVLKMAPADECEYDMFVMVKWHGRELGVPLAQIIVIDGDDDVLEAVGDWHYWVNRGYQFE